MQLRELSFSEKRDWLRLSRSLRVGPVAFRDLLARYKSAEAAIDALPSIMRRKDSVVPQCQEVEAEMEEADRRGVKILAACEADYPLYLKAIDPPPPLISVIGRTDILHKPCAAIVGSRNASAIGQRFARQIAGELGDAGFTIISGLARGIDANAHGGALKTGTAAVLGGGVDHIYPRQNTELYEAMAEQGALISESPLGYRATARDFPRRNRIISGLSMGVIVIEAAERSGTLITARYATEQNREVMAAPGSPLDPRTKGCNRLIQQGAALIESAQDIINCLENIRPPQMMEPNASYEPAEFDWKSAEKDIEKARVAVLSLLSPTPTPRDEIIRLSGFTTALVTAALLEMELNGEAVVEADGRVALGVSF
ncbi:DNA-processing protein DprA [Hellea balneolensis]|uniref:DNA-processing protein DprA n=1 Tax=Hellea balneolensis TaxID=287478 RepID=UPI0003F8724F|nr:DNA-processing protein DprA [Hellea balneolensis]